MAKNYTRPLAEVYQLLEVTRQATGDHLSACIVGPTYDLYRYGIEKDVKGYTYSGAATLSIVYDQEAIMVYKLDNTIPVKVFFFFFMVCERAHSSKSENSGSLIHIYHK